MLSPCMELRHTAVKHNEDVYVIIDCLLCTKPSFKCYEQGKNLWLHGIDILIKDTNRKCVNKHIIEYVLKWSLF